MEKNFLQVALRVLIEKSVRAYLTSLETPNLPTLDLKADFTWDEVLTSNQFKPATNLIFEIVLSMDSKGAFYTTNPRNFKVFMYQQFDLNEIGQTLNIE